MASVHYQATSKRRQYHEITYLLCGCENTGRTCLTTRYMYDIYAPGVIDPTDDDPAGPREKRYITAPPQQSPNSPEGDEDWGITENISPPQPLSVVTDPGRWKHADVLLLVYAVNNLASFESLRDLSWDLKDKFDVGDALIKVIVATQADLPEDDWAVSRSDGAALASSRGCDFVVTSALDGQGLDKAFGPYDFQVIARRAEEARLWSLREWGPKGPPKDKPAKRHSWQSIKGRISQMLTRR